MGKQSCGNCGWFIKVKSIRCDSGLCSFYDCRAKTDWGKGCIKHKGIKYKRQKFDGDGSLN